MVSVKIKSPHNVMARNVSAEVSFASEAHCFNPSQHSNCNTMMSGCEDIAWLHNVSLRCGLLLAALSRRQRLLILPVVPTRKTIVSPFPILSCPQRESIILSFLCNVLFLHLLFGIHRVTFPVDVRVEVFPVLQFFLMQMVTVTSFLTENVTQMGTWFLLLQRRTSFHLNAMVVIAMTDQFFVPMALTPCLTEQFNTSFIVCVMECLVNVPSEAKSAYFPVRCMEFLPVLVPFVTTIQCQNNRKIPVIRIICILPLLLSLRNISDSRVVVSHVSSNLC